MIVGTLLRGLLNTARTNPRPPLPKPGKRIGVSPFSGLIGLRERPGQRYGIGTASNEYLIMIIHEKNLNGMQARALLVL